MACVMDNFVGVRGLPTDSAATWGLWRELLLELVGEGEPRKYPLLCVEVVEVLLPLDTDLLDLLESALARLELGLGLGLFG